MRNILTDVDFLSMIESSNYSITYVFFTYHIKLVFYLSENNSISFRNMENKKPGFS